MAPSTEVWMSHYCGLFGMGMLAADTRLEGHSLGYRILKIATPLLFILVCAASWAVPKDLWFASFVPIQIILGVAAASSMCLMKNGHYANLRAALSHRWLATVGLASYSLYLIHAPLLQLFSKYVSHPFVKHVLNPSWKFSPLFEYVLFLVVCIPAMTLISIAFAYIFEGSYFRKGWSDLTRRFTDSSHS
jgi:peptidoglycan/LPS O-acetylase OafA/YrhL